MLTRKKNVALVVCLLGGAGGAVGGFAPWMSTSVAPGFFSYDTSCDISSTGDAQRRAVVWHVTNIEDDDDVTVSLDGNVDLGAAGATYDRTFPALLTDLSSADADAVGIGCNTWHGSADVRIKTRIKVVATRPTIEVDIWTTSKPGEHFQAHAELGGTGIGDVASIASYDIHGSDELEVLVPFTVDDEATKIEVLENKITRSQTDDMSGCSGTDCHTQVDWWIFEEGDTNCVASNTELASDCLLQNGDGNTGDGTFTITLDIETPTDYVLKVRYETTHTLAAHETCGNGSTLSGTSRDHFELELKAL